MSGIAAAAAGGVGSGFDKLIDVDVDDVGSKSMVVAFMLCVLRCCIGLSGTYHTTADDIGWYIRNQRYHVSH